MRKTSERRPKRDRKELLLSVLKVLNDGKSHAYGDIERKVNTNWKSVRDACEEMVRFGAVDITEEGVKITKLGRDALKKST